MMADLNLDGLPVLTTLTTGIECNVPVEIRLQVIVELGELVKREGAFAFSRGQADMADKLRELPTGIVGVSGVDDD